jgi:GDP-4-dehydro-6-deoxy-D-mannose reductase
VKALVTGANGFCGKHLVARLLARRIEVVATDVTPTRASPHGAIYVQADVRNGSFDTVVESHRPDWLFHLAAASPNNADTTSIYETNLAGTLRVLQVVKRLVPRCRVLLVGSFAEYGPVPSVQLPVSEETPCQPVGPYGISKFASTLVALELARTLELEISIARPSNIVGSGIPPTLVVGALLERARAAMNTPTPRVRVGDVESERDYIAVDDVVEAYVDLLQGGHTGLFNLCSGVPRTVWAVATTLFSISNRPIALEADRDLVPSSPIRSIYGTSAKANAAFGFRTTTPLEVALKAAWDQAFVGASCA